MKILSYSELQEFIIRILTENISSQSGDNEQSDAENNAPHGAFWKEMTYEEFTSGNIFGNIPILEIGNSGNSNLILALKGAPPFDGSSFRRMPSDGPPFFTPEQIQLIADWIDDGCPE